MSKTRIYAIRSSGKIVGLARAATPAQALRVHITGSLSADVPTQDELLQAFVAGHRPAEIVPNPDPLIPTLTDPVDDGHDGSETD